MTKEITKAFILQEIQDKFKLRELIPEIFSFSENVIPIYDIGPHLQKWQTSKKVTSVTSAAAFKIFTVPQDKRWIIRSYMVIPMGAGAFTWAGLYIQRSSQYFMYLDLKAAQTVATLTTLPTFLPLNPNDEIYLNIDGYTSTQNVEVYIDYVMEEIR